MELSYQALDFDLGRTRAAVAHLAAAVPEARAALTTLVVGDLSCSFRNQHTLAERWESEAWAGFRAWRRAEGLRLLWQLPLVVKETEIPVVAGVVERVWDDVDGFVCGDPGFLAEVAERMSGRAPKALVLAANAHNPTTARLWAERLPLEALRPIFPKRDLLRGRLGVPREVVAYGNLLINCSIYCFHCGDLPTRCDFSCHPPKHLVMEGERVAMVGRSLMTTESRLDLVDLLPELPDVVRAVIVDLDLAPDELADAARRILSATAAAPRRP